MVNIDDYILRLIKSLNEFFGARLLYVGLQGSYFRGEATPHSDIDIMIIIDNLTVEDLDSYRSIIQSLENYEKSCGFICSREDISNWNPLEIFHLLNSTKDYQGVLSELVPCYTEQDIRNYIKFSINNLYHEICHSYIHSDYSENITQLPIIYKSVFFILQNLHYLTSGEFILKKSELLSRLNGKDFDVLECAIHLSKEREYDFHKCFELLFLWCQETMRLI